MSFDASRFTFNPAHDYLGVVMQQGRVQLDSDWNDWVAQVIRRMQVGAADTVGAAVVPRSTPQGFRIELLPDGKLTIGEGRIYVDGFLAENHGLESTRQWDAHLAELVGGAPVVFFDQPYLPFNPRSAFSSASGASRIFDPPKLDDGPYLVYLDIWQREVTPLQAPDLVEKAVGVDTTGRLQTVWQVKVLSNIGKAGCATPDDELPGWSALTRPSGARLSTSPVTLTSKQSPCTASHGTAYKGLENQLYRVEIHRGGPRATFKWSRDNASVAARVLAIHGGNHLVLESLGRDEVLGFRAGDWVEVLDDWHELHGLPGSLRRIRASDGVDAATRSIKLDTPLPVGLFLVDGEVPSAAKRNTRVRRWDQAGVVLRDNGSDSGLVHFDLNAADATDGIPVPEGAKLILEDGIGVEFSLAPGGEFKTGDHWVFAARTSDGDFERLVDAPPRGIHHHYARLAIVSSGKVADCRKIWPPEPETGACECTVCVRPEAHNAGTATIQQAIDTVRARGGGTVCLDAGHYWLRAPLIVENARSLHLRGQGWRTLLQPVMAGGAITVANSVGVTIKNLSIAGMVAAQGATAMVDIAQAADVQLVRVTIAALTEGPAKSAAVSLSRVVFGASIRDSLLLASQAVVSGGNQRDYLFSANFSLTGNILMAGEYGVVLGGDSVHYGQLRIANNLIVGCRGAGIELAGAALPAAGVTVEGNVLHVSGGGVSAGIEKARITGNEISGLTQSALGQGKRNGIQLTAGFAKGRLDGVTIADNCVMNLAGDGIHIDTPLGFATVTGNSVERMGGAGLIMSANASAVGISISENRFAELGLAVKSEDASRCFGVLVMAAKNADVVGNTLINLARQATKSSLVAGVMVVATREPRVSRNRVQGIGPLQGSSNLVVGVAMSPGFSDTVIDGNEVARISADAEKADTGKWQALRVVGALNTVPGQFAETLALPSAVVLPVKGGHVYLARGGVLQLSGAGNVTIQANHVRSQVSSEPAVDVIKCQACTFSLNDINTSAGKDLGTMAGRLICDHANVANNRLVGAIDLSIFDGKPKFVVLGNIVFGGASSMPIRVNGSGVPAPWNALNVVIN